MVLLCQLIVPAECCYRSFFTVKTKTSQRLSIDFRWLPHAANSCFPYIVLNCHFHSSIFMSTYIQDIRIFKTHLVSDSFSKSIILLFVSQYVVKVTHSLCALSVWNVFSLPNKARLCTIFKFSCFTQYV